MIDAYSSIISYEEDDWSDFFTKICILDIFKELIARHGVNKDLLRSYIKYIVWTYSKDSEKVIIGSDWGKNKRRIFDEAGFEPKDILLDSTVNLKDDVVLQTIQKWLDFQDDLVYTQICVLKDLMVEMQLSANGDIKKSSGETDYDQKYKNACYVKELRTMIKDLQSELIQNSKTLKEAVKEVNQASNSNTISAEKMFTRA